MERKPEDDPQVRLRVMRAAAVASTMREVVGEQRLEIIRRAKAKLVAMGVAVEDADPGAELGTHL